MRLIDDACPSFNLLIPQLRVESNHFHLGILGASFFVFKERALTQYLERQVSNFLGNFTPKTSNYCPKSRALGFPGTLVGQEDIWKLNPSGFYSVPWFGASFRHANLWIVSPFLATFKPSRFQYQLMWALSCWMDFVGIAGFKNLHLSVSLSGRRMCEAIPWKRSRYTSCEAAVLSHGIKICGFGSWVSGKLVEWVHPPKTNAWIPKMMGLGKWVSFEILAILGIYVKFLGCTHYVFWHKQFAPEILVVERWLFGGDKVQFLRGRAVSVN